MAGGSQFLSHPLVPAVRTQVFLEAGPFSKVDSERQLNLSGTRKGVGNYAGGRVRSATSGQRGGARKAKICMIQNIEHLEPKRRIGGFGQFKAFLQHEVHIRKARADNRISFQVSIGSSQRERAGTGIIPVIGISQGVRGTSHNSCREWLNLMVFCGAESTR